MILAGVSIATLTGDNGILTRASDAKEQTEIAEIKEQIQTDILGEQAGNQGDISDGVLKSILKKYGEINYDEDGTTIKSITTTKGNYEIAIGDIWTGTTTISKDGSWNGKVNTPKIDGTGLTAVYWNGSEWVELTSASSQEEWNNWYNYSNQNWANAKSADGSMWVWIPRYEYRIDTSNKTISVNFVEIGAPTTDGYTLHPAFGTDINNGGWSEELPGFWVAKYAAGYQNATEGDKTINLSRYAFDSVTGEARKSDGGAWKEETLTEHTYDNVPAKDIEDFITKVNSTGGYYFARYEARTETQRKNKEDVLTQLTVKQNDYVYNYVTQVQAANLSRNMYADINFESDLVNSYAWETTLVFLQECDDREETNNKPYSIQNSLNTSLATRGTNNLDIKDKICNIFDMASNCYEWLTLTSNESQYPAIDTGGNFKYSNEMTKSKNSGAVEGNSHDDISFRPIIYL